MPTRLVVWLLHQRMVVSGEMGISVHFFSSLPVVVLVLLTRTRNISERTAAAWQRTHDEGSNAKKTEAPTRLGSSMEPRGLEWTTSVKV